MDKARGRLFFRLFMVTAIIAVSMFILWRRAGVSLPLGTGDVQTVLREVRLPDGFKIALYAKNVIDARSLAQGENGTLFVGTRNAGKVYAIVDENKDMVADQIYTIASGLYMPCGVAFSEGSLYVAEVNRVLRFDNIETALASPPAPVIVNDSFPDDAWHGWKFIRFGPDEKLYVPVGAPCNVCEKEDQRYSTIMRMNKDGSELEVFASGIRNTVGFNWHPQTKELWFTENGRDWLGDDMPPDELNHAPEPDMHFGFPYFHGNQMPDPEFGINRDPASFTPCVQELGAHVAALGMRFYTGSMFPKKYHNQILIAEHGSWNRSRKQGYRISLVTLEEGRPASYESFADGFMKDEKVFGRPVDIEQLEDGSILVSDDFAHAIYRISKEP